MTAGDVVEAADVQGLVAAGYGHLTAACYVLLRADDVDRAAASARAWLGELAGRVTTAAARPAQQAVNAAFTHKGLLALGLAPDLAGGFSQEFIGGMAVPHRSRLLGDTGDSDPAHWAWGGPSTPAVDVLLLLYATDQTALEELYASERQLFTDAGLVELHRLDTVDLGGVEPFSFADGISQPTVEGLQQGGRDADRIKAGEFVLGYPNEYGLYTDSPTASDGDRAAKVLPASPNGKGRDFGRNGTYLVFRQLAQDVDGFWGFLEESTRRPDGTADRAAATRLAAKIVGRWPSGAPLVLAPDGDDPALATANDFEYAAIDPHGLRCPLGSHIRRTNPRDSLPPKPGTQASTAVNKRHRLIRRGREQRAADSTGTNPRSRGLHFICLNANIARQFEFVQGTWINNPKFNGLYEDADPLVATDPHRSLRIPAAPVRERLCELPSFVQVEAGGYFFLPGVRALRYVAALSG